MFASNYRLIIIYFSAEFWPTKELFQVRPQHMMYVYFFKQVRLNSTTLREHDISLVPYLITVIADQDFRGCA